MDARLPTVLHPLIEQYVVQWKECLPGIAESFYLVGSLALGEFNPLYSDIDFVTVVRRELSATETETLRHLHRDIEDRFPRWRMSGSYIRAYELGKLDETLEAHLHYHGGRLRLQQRNELNPVTWWELKNYGITVFGIPPQHLPLSIMKALASG